MKTKIVVTTGPATDSADAIVRLAKLGMNIARVNCSHLTSEEARARIQFIQKVREQNKLDFRIMLDTKGPDIRIGKFENEKITLVDGQTFTLTTKPTLGNQTRVFANYNRLARVVSPGQIMLLNDGMIRMTVQSTTDTDVICKVDMGGVLSGNKSLFVPGCALGLPFLSDADKADLKVAAEVGCDLVAASFVGTKQNLIDMTDWLKQCGRAIPIISKIESVEGVTNLDEIIAETYGIMVARGDLGVEYPIEQVPALQKMMVEKCAKSGKFCIVATEMMESMIDRPRPTRAEVTDITIAVWQGATALMLSAETAVGKFPFLAVEYMVRIAKEAQNSLPK